MRVHPRDSPKEPLRGCWWQGQLWHPMVCAPRLGSASPVQTRALPAGVYPNRQTYPLGQQLATSYKPNPSCILLCFCQSTDHHKKTNKKKPNPKAQRCSHLFCHEGNACACKYAMCLIYSLLRASDPLAPDSSFLQSCRLFHARLSLIPSQAPLKCGDRAVGKQRQPPWARGRAAGGRSGGLWCINRRAQTQPPGSGISGVPRKEGEGKQELWLQNMAPAVQGDSELLLRTTSGNCWPFQNCASHPGKSLSLHCQKSHQLKMH